MTGRETQSIYYRGWQKDWFFYFLGIQMGNFGVGQYSKLLLALFKGEYIPVGGCRAGDIQGRTGLGRLQVGRGGVGHHGLPNGRLGGDASK